MDARDVLKPEAWPEEQPCMCQQRTVTWQFVSISYIKTPYTETYTRCVYGNEAIVVVCGYSRLSREL